MSNCCALPPTCGICICNPSMCRVGVCAATGNPGFPVCGGSVGTASCGMAQVTIAGTPIKSSVVLWLLGGAAALYLLKRYR
jgi:hypothetical protein